MSLVHNYFTNMKQVLERIERTQLDNIERAAERIADSLENGGIWHLLDTGHMLMYEAVGRTGGMMAVRPVRVTVEVDNPTRYREEDIGKKKRVFMDEVAGLPAFIVGKSKMMPGDVLMIGSVSGINILPVEMAIYAREMGITVIALTSVEYSGFLQPMHPGGKRLYEVCDIVLDNCSQVGDTVVQVEELGQGLCPSSGIAASYMMWAIQTRVVELLLARGKKPSVYVSNHMPGAAKHNSTAWANYEKEGY
ncbi:sugar isomerase domain-containing protein [Paenibacillus koleovorans]|uniref:sugar isomerase domain-containing protein n=1 Tax=Paenibacillus koleovorans TaxID=121608 RepID=UPI000FDA6F32|nr:sugar isomerase domain-containing protein [Paenibacillus koleovorans]